MHRLAYVVSLVMVLTLGPGCMALGPTTGQVIDAAGKPIADATVTVQNTGVAVQTNDQGHFVIHLDNQPSVVLRVTKNGYARTSYIVNDSNIGSIVVHVQPVDTAVTLTLPTTGQANAVVSVNRPDCSAELQIPPNSLVTPSGAVASGNVTVVMTYWDGMRGMITSPGPLLGKPDVVGKAPTPLASLGMADIEVQQGNDILQVAAGSYLPFNVTVPATLRNSLTVPSLANNTYLIWLDPNAGLWEKVAPMGSTMFQYDAGLGQLRGLLPHLSAWNYDEFGGVQGCVQGRVLDCSKNPIPNTPFLGWLMNIEGLYRAHWATDSNGNYCEDIDVPTNDPASDGQWSFPIHLSGNDGSTDSNMNPTVIPSACVDCVNDGLAESGFADKCYCGKYNGTFGDTFCPAAYTSCAWVGNQYTSAYSQESFDYTGVVADKIVTVTAGVTCENAASSCVQLPDLVIGTCSGGLPITGSACAGPDPKYQGADCAKDSECCATTTPLVCLDNLCVPSSD